MTVRGESNADGSSAVVVEYSVEAAGRYRVTVLHARRRLGRYRVDVLPGDVARVEVVDGDVPRVLQLEAGNEVRVRALDAFGNVCFDEIDPDELKLDGGRHAVVVAEEATQTFSIHFAAAAKGFCRLAVRFRDHVVLQGPQSVALSPRAAAKALDMARSRRVELAVNCNGTAAWLRMTDRSIAIRRSSFLYNLTGLWATPMVKWRLARSVALEALTDGRVEDLILHNGAAERFVLKCKDPPATLVYAVFANLIDRRTGHGLTFDERRALVKRALPNPPRGLVLSGILRVNVRRASLYQDAYGMLNDLSDSNWRRKFSIRFRGEEGIDVDGVSRDFFDNLLRAAVTESLALTTIGSDGRVHLARRADVPALKGARFVGKLLGKVLYDGRMYGLNHHLPFRPTRSLLKLLLGQVVSTDDFSVDDPELHKSMIEFIATTDDVESLGLTFEDEVWPPGASQPLTVPLRKHGGKIGVTTANRGDYLNRLALNRLGLSPASDRKPHPIVAAMLEGLHSVVGDDALAVLDDCELELLLCGVPTIDVHDMRVHTSFDRGNRTIAAFWDWLLAADDETRARTLRFITGSSQVPAAGFGALEPRLCVVVRPGASAERLPVAHTCANQLELAPYRTEHVVAARMQIALAEEVGFGIA